MKLCIWTSSIFKLGGTKRVITVIANELCKEHDVTIMTYEAKETENRSMYGLDERIKIDYIKGKQFRDNKKSIPKYYRTAIKYINNQTGLFNRQSTKNILSEAFYPRVVRDKWVSYLNEKDYDVIIATASLSLLLASIAEEVKANTVGWQHNCYDAYINKKAILFWKKEELLKSLLPKLNAYVVLSNYDKVDYEEKLGITCKVMENPRSFTSEIKTDIMQKNFFVAARFVEAKGLDLLMDSFQEFCKVNKEWNLIIAGDGPLREEVEREIEKYGLHNRVDLIGTTDEVQRYFLQSSIYLLSSRWEGWGLVITEAFEMGLPVIAYDIVPIDFIITDGKDGIIVEKYDTKAFAKAMLELAQNDALREKMSVHAIERAKDFSVEHICSKWNDLLTSL